MSKYLYLPIAFAFALSISSCTKDTEAPTVNFITPANHSNHEMGEELHIQAIFSDNEALATYELFIGDVDGEHTHDFHFKEEKDIEGTSHELHTHTDIPEDIGEVYYLHYVVKDEEGNSFADKVMLHLKEGDGHGGGHGHGEVPMAMFSAPENHSDHKWGDNITVTATLMDAEGLASYKLYIGDKEGNHMHDFDFKEEMNIEGTSYDLNSSITVPSGIGEVYYLHIDLTDTDDNTVSSKLMLHFSE